jgi:transcriptional regulator with XRE-family HTH domain
MLQGDRIKSARKLASLSQAELAIRCGVAQNTISRLESGALKSLRGKTLLLMSKALGCSPEWLSGGEETSSQSAMSKNEQTLVASFRRLSTNEKRVVLKLVHGLAAAGEP